MKMAFRRPKALGDYLVNAKLKSMCTGVRPTVKELENKQ